LAPARIGKLVPGFCHLLKLLAVSRRGSARHVSAFSGVLLILVDLLHDETALRLRKILMSRVRTEKQREYGRKQVVALEKQFFTLSFERTALPKEHIAN
jgi:hypothetical protein